MKIYTIAEDYYKGKPNRIGATGLETLYYYVPEGNPLCRFSRNVEKIMEMALTGVTAWGVVGPMFSQ